MILYYSLDDGSHDIEHAYETDGGYDLRCVHGATIESFGSHVFDTGVHLEIPRAYAGLLVSKSGLNVVHSLTGTGLIDSGFTGSVKVRVYNLGERAYRFEDGDKVVQIVFVPVMNPSLVRRKFVLGGERGDNGYGSTGR